MIPISSHQDTIGPTIRSIADAAAILTTIAGRVGKDNYTQTAPAAIPGYTKFLNANATKGRRFGLPRAGFTNDTITRNDPYIDVGFNKSLETIRALEGTMVDPANLPSAYVIATSGDMLFMLEVDPKMSSVWSKPKIRSPDCRHVKD